MELDKELGKIDPDPFLVHRATELLRGDKFRSQSLPLA